MNDKPLVSIFCITYNHGAFIRQCLDGFMMQKTDFPFEVIIHDDASTDGTTDIIREYAAKYPEVIKPLYETENQYSQGKLGDFVFDMWSRFQGKYVAICDGDDYWTDPDKLQKQVDFLEAHPECSICFHMVEFLYEDEPDKTEVWPLPKHRFYKNILTLDDLLQTNFIPALSVMYRWRFFDEDIESAFPRNIFMGDWYLHLLHAQKGDIGIIEDVMGVYRKHSGGMWSGTKDQESRIREHGLEMINFHDNVCKHIAPNCAEYKTSVLVPKINEALSVFTENNRTKDMALLFEKYSECCVHNYLELYNNYVGLYKLSEKQRATIEKQRQDREEQNRQNEAGSLQSDGSSPRFSIANLFKKKSGSTELSTAGRKDSPSGIPGQIPVSIIVPVYNKEEYLEQCLDSILEQTFGQFELILVDDCSTDGSGAICDKYVKYDQRIKVIHKPENEGLTLARKTGLAAAKGDFILHVDSDDWLDKKALETMYRAAIAEDYDITVFDYYCEYEDETVYKEEPFFCSEDENGDIYQDPDRTTVDKSIFLKQLLISKGITPAFWNKLIKRSLYANDLMFPRITFTEDLAVMPQLAYYANNIGYIPQALYHYRQLPVSASHSPSKEKRLSNIYEFYLANCTLLQFFQKHTPEQLLSVEESLEKHIDPLFTWQEVPDLIAPYTIIQRRMLKILMRNDPDMLEQIAEEQQAARKELGLIS